MRNILTNTEIKAVKAKEKKYHLNDGEGLQLLIQPSEIKTWYYRWKVNGHEIRMSLGRYPAVSLANARKRRDKCEKEVAMGKDPRRNKHGVEDPDATLFRNFAEQYLDQQANILSPDHLERQRRRLALHAYPKIGHLHIQDIGVDQVRPLLKAIPKDNGERLETAHRVRTLLSQVFRQGIADGVCEVDPAEMLSNLLPARVVKHYPTIIDPKQITHLLRCIDNYHGGIVVKAALQFMPLVFQRPGAVRLAEWNEVDFEGAIWEIPAARLKRTKENKNRLGSHIVPLSKQALGVLTSLKEYTGETGLVFAGAKHGRPVSDATVRNALISLGFGPDVLVPHGFRAMATSLLVGVGRFDPKAVDIQLAHVEKSKTQSAYHRFEYLDERTQMMQWWADYLDGLRAS